MPTDEEFDDKQFTAIRFSTPPRWIRELLHIKQINAKTMPVNNVVTKMAAEIASCRGKPIRHLRTTGKDGKPSAFLSITVDGFHVRVLNRKSPILLEKTEANIRWLQEQLVADKERFTLQDADEQVSENRSTDPTEHRPDEVDDDPITPVKTNFDSMYAASYDEDLPPRVWWCRSKKAYVASHFPRPEGKAKREMFAVKVRKTSDLDVYADERNAQKKRAVHFAEYGVTLTE